jgi:flagellar protein FlaJ
MSFKDPLVSQIEEAKKRMMWMRVLREPREMIRRNPLTSAIFSISFSSVFFLIGFMNLKSEEFLDDLVIISILISIAPVGFLYDWYDRRWRKMEDRFIDFIRDLTDVTRAGMTLSEALITVAKRDYGALNDELRRMGNLISWGIPFNDVFQRFAERVKSNLIKRTVSLILQANISGGNFEDVITSAARDAKEMKLLEEERRGNMFMYTLIVYISFLVFLFVVAVLAKMFIPEIAKVSASGTTLGGFSFNVSSKEIEKIFFHSSIIQAFFSGLIAGKMGEGSVFLGIKHSVILVLIAYSVFTFFI